MNAATPVEAPAQGEPELGVQLVELPSPGKRAGSTIRARDVA
ncbi:MAG: hypothetical protein JWP68_1739 [Modestobacter sp.]|nr:hypothetical protein [Modestobacter sp.]